MLKKSIIFLLLTGTINCLFAQRGESDFLNWMLKAEQQGANASTPLSELQKKQFLYPEWKTGKVVLTDSSEKQVPDLRYNIVLQEMQFLKGNKVFAITQPASFQTIYLDKHKFRFIQYKKKNTNPAYSFLEILSEGKINLLLLREKSFKPGTPAQPYKEAVPDDYPTRKTYFVQINNEIPVEIKLRRRKIMALFNDKKEQMENFRKEQRINMNNQKELIQLFDYYNSL